MWSIRRPDGTVAAGWYLMPLRLFLGVTFLFAGLQKIANPQFFDAANPTSIHAQLMATAHSSPISALTRHLLEHANAVGWLIAIGEVAIGTGVIAGLWTRLAAAGGMALSLGLFLTVSFHSSPYYTGSDIVFLFAWTPLLLAGAGGAPAVDTWNAAREREVAADGAGLTRRAVLSKAAVTGAAAGVVVVSSGLAAGLGRAIGGAKGTSAQPSGTLSGGGSGPAPSPSTTTPTGGSTPATDPSGTAIGPASDVPVGGSASFTDPATQDPSLVIQQTAGNFVAFDAVCPHAGCTVAYQASARIIACPCHGSEFNPRTGDVVRGPAPIGLTTISVVKGADGNLYVRK
jgi:thiosulfate dehydrogenase (quinone) large subunit